MLIDFLSLLPYHIQTRILHYLDADSILVAPLVCSKWYDILKPLLHSLCKGIFTHFSLFTFHFFTFSFYFLLLFYVDLCMKMFNVKFETGYHWKQVLNACLKTSNELCTHLNNLNLSYLAKKSV